MNGLFCLNTTFLGINITDLWYLFCHGVARAHPDMEIEIVEFADHFVFDALNNPFEDSIGTPAKNLPKIEGPLVSASRSLAHTPLPSIPESVQPASHIHISSIKSPESHASSLTSLTFASAHTISMAKKAGGQV